MLMKPRGRLTGEGEWEIAREAKRRSRESSSLTQRNRPATPRGGVLTMKLGGRDRPATPRGGVLTMKLGGRSSSP